ncbi:uncharacterized protein LOC131673671 [Phymastichus coffea]|uniref:uncharacterized protein LOC131673671 n=1 Tax=Phymastichus coffea TaxID=108790 RepID=UPI00273B7E9E|nr:uncharacterized protein LOC131673671 [Phymastichus coffea]
MPGLWILLHTLIYMMAGPKSLVSSSDIWPLERPEGMPAIQSLEVMCGKDHMDVHLSFSQPFEGIVSSKGQHSDPRCVYVPPSTGQTFFSFRIAYARCGTKPDMHGQFYENTVVVQYDKDLLEVWDEAKRLRCEWFNDYEKTASKPPMVIADLDVIQLDFRGDNVDCWMEIQHGKGPWAPPVSGIVPLGSTLTLVVAINDYRGNEPRHSKVQGEFDMRVKSCVASDGAGHTIQLSDEFGCVLRPKMISRFLKARGSDDRATVITYAFFHAFKFPDALSVHIKCKVEICRHGCLDHCQTPGVGVASGEALGHYVQERNDVNVQLPQQPAAYVEPDMSVSSARPSADDGTSYDDDIVSSLASHFLGLEKSAAPKAQAQQQQQQQQQQSPSTSTFEPTLDSSDDPLLSQPFLSVQPARVTRYQPQEHFPHGPRNLEQDDTSELRQGKSREPTNEEADNDKPSNDDTTVNKTKPLNKSTTTANRRKRSLVVSDRKVRNADVGVSGIYEVISEADLAFSPDSHAEAVTVFQGRIREEVVYGICLPLSGFSALFVVVALSAIVSALIAGAMVHRLQVQRELARNARKNMPASLAAIGRRNSAQQHHHHQQSGWLQAYGLFRARCAQQRVSDNRTSDN